MKTLVTSLFSCFYLLSCPLFSQKPVYDTLLILGHKYPLERTTPYFTGTEEMPIAVFKMKHKNMTGKRTSIDMYSGDGLMVGEFDQDGYESMIESFKNTAHKTYTLWCMTDTLVFGKQNASKPFSLKVGGQLMSITQAQFIASNDTCSKVMSICSAHSVLQNVIWYTEKIKPTYIYMTSVFYLDKNKDMILLPIQFCLKLE